MDQIAVAGRGWSGLARGPTGERDLTRRGRAVGHAIGHAVVHATDAENLARLFPGRWNARRALPAGLDPLVAAFAMALQEAGWWAPGDREPVQGALVLGTDSYPLVSAAAFAREMADRGAGSGSAGGGNVGGISPTGFLFSLPSSATAVLGILFGLRDYQATVTEGGLSGVRALAHAVDLIRLGRIRRAAVGVLSIARTDDTAHLLPGRSGAVHPLAAPEAGLDLAVALCIEPCSAGGGGAPGDRRLPRVEDCCILDRPPEGAVSQAGESDIEPDLRPLAAPSLLAVVREFDRAPDGPRTLIHSEPGRPGFGVVRIRSD